MATTTKRELLENLRTMLREALHLRESGVAYAKLARAHGYIDGYMRVLMETGVATQAELLHLVSSVRASSQGPATAEIQSDAVAVA
jgi:hypothetical protein